MDDRTLLLALGALEASPSAEDREQERRALAAIVEATPDFIGIGDAELNLTYLNPAARQLLRTEGREVQVGSPLTDYQPWWAAVKVLDEGVPRARLESVWRGETALLAPDGREIPISQVIVPLPGEDPKTPRYYATLIRDLRAQKARERRIRESKAWFRALMRSAPDSVYVMSYDGCIRDVNDAACRELQYRRDELIGRYARDLASDYSDHALDRLVRRVGREREVKIFGHLRRRDGEKVPMETRMRLLRRDGEAVILCVARNMNDWLEAQEEAERGRIRAEQADQAKTVFLATASHEVRTPLNAIVGLTDLLRNTGLGDEQREYVDLLQRSAGNLQGLIENVLDWSKVQVGQLDLDWAEVDLSDLVQEVIAVAELSAAQKGLSVHGRVDPSLPSAVVADRRRLHQILTNLLGNAVKFTQEGRVRLDVRPGDPASGEVCFEVGDTGPGIPERVRNRIFEPFTQGGETIHRDHGGTGLGLSITSGVVQQMGGTIDLESELGAGTRFRVVLPLAPAEDDAPDESATVVATTRDPSGRVHGRRARARVLLAEDDDLNAMVVQGCLREQPYDVERVSSGDQAVAVFQQQPPDLVLMDIEMPRMDGHEAIRRIRAWELENGIGPVPVLTLTAHAFEEQQKASIEAGSSDHLTKPIPKADLIAAVARWLPHVEGAGSPGND